MSKNYKDVFASEELAHLRIKQKEALEKARRLPELTDEEEARIHAGALSDPDAQPLTDEELARFRPAYQVMPEFVAKMIRSKRGHSQVETPKKWWARREPWRTSPPRSFPRKRESRFFQIDTSAL